MLFRGHEGEIFLDKKKKKKHLCLLTSDCFFSHQPHEQEQKTNAHCRRWREGLTGISVQVGSRIGKQDLLPLQYSIGLSVLGI